MKVSKKIWDRLLFESKTLRVLMYYKHHPGRYKSKDLARESEISVESVYSLWRQGILIKHKDLTFSFNDPWVMGERD